MPLRRLGRPEEVRLARSQDDKPVVFLFGSLVPNRHALEYKTTPCERRSLEHLSVHSYGQIRLFIDRSLEVMQLVARSPPLVTRIQAVLFLLSEER